MADITGLGAVLSIGSTLIDRLFPDKVQQDAAKLKLLELQQTGALAQLAAETDLAKGQIDVNKIEAASDSIFKSGWRPAAGWACVGGLTYQILLRPIAGWICAGLWHWAPPPALEMDTLMTLLTGLLGLGAYRMTEKIRGVA